MKNRTPHTPKPENAKQANIWFEADVLEALDAEAAKRERSRSYVVAKAVEQYLKRARSGRGRRTARSEGRASTERTTTAPNEPGARVADNRKRSTKSATKKAMKVVEPELAEPLPPYNPLLDFIEAKQLAKALKAEIKGGKPPKRRGE